VVLVPRPGRLYRSIKARLRPCDLGAQTLAEISRIYGLGQLRRCQTPGAGRKSMVLILTGERGKGVLKRFREGKPLPAVLFVHSVLARLRELDFPALRPRLTQDGRDLVSLNGYHYALYEFMSGYRYTDFYVMSKSLECQYIARAGAVLARYHRLMADFLPQGRLASGYKALGTKERWDTYSWYRTEWNRLTAQPTLRRDGRQLFSPATACYVERKLAGLDQGEREQPLLPVTVVHGDYGPHNLFFGPGATFRSVLDFNAVRLEQRIDEVAAGLRRFAGLSSGGLDLDKARVFLEAYQAVTPLTAEELERLPYVFTRIRLRGLVKGLSVYQDTGSRLTRYNIRDALAWLDWLDTRGPADLCELTEGLLKG
jgi:Ser/Thr protein kinase RdoA (MazF antagonist)